MEDLIKKNLTEEYPDKDKEIRKPVDKDNNQDNKLKNQRFFNY